MVLTIVNMIKYKHEMTWDLLKRKKSGIGFNLPQDNLRNLSVDKSKANVRRCGKMSDNLVESECCRNNTNIFDEKTKLYFFDSVR